MNADERTLRSLFAQIPDVQCKGLCTDSCGPVIVNEIEHAIAGVDIDFDRETLTCNQLHEGRCAIYDNRPLVCRLWGAVPEMRCPFGCEPTLTSEAGQALMRGLFAAK